MKVEDLKLYNTVKRFGQIVYINIDGMKLLEKDNNSFQPVNVNELLLSERGFTYEDGHFYKKGVPLRITLTKNYTAKIAYFKSKNDFNNKLLTEKRYIHEIENIFNSIKN